MCTHMAMILRYRMVFQLQNVPFLLALALVYETFRNPLSIQTTLTDRWRKTDYRLAVKPNTCRNIETKMLTDV